MLDGPAECQVSERSSAGVYGTDDNIVLFFIFGNLSPHVAEVGVVTTCVGGVTSK